MRKLIAFTSALLFTGSALAASSVATINVTNGSVLVNQGKQFVTAQPSQVLAVGDRVMVMEGGKATINYADGCVQTLNSGSLAVVPQQSVCASGLNDVAQISPVSAQAAGDRLGDGDCDGDNILDKNDTDIDGDGTLNPQDNQNICTKPGAWSNATGTWAAFGVTAGLYFVLYGDDDNSVTISP